MSKMPDKGRMSLEARAKLSARNKGNKYALGCTRSKRTRALMAASKIGNKFCLGRECSAETRAKISAALAGRPNGNKGLKWKEIIAKSRRQARLAKPVGPIARTAAERYAARLGIPVVEHSTLRGVVPDYATDRAAFYCPEAR